MDLVWRVVVDFILQGRSMSMQVAIDKEHSRVCFHDEISPIPLKALKRWSTLRRSRSVRGEAARELEDAIEARDILELRRLVPAAIQRACMRIRIESQEAEAPRSIHAAWYSPMFHVEPIVSNNTSNSTSNHNRQRSSGGSSNNSFAGGVGVPTWTCTWGPRASYSQGCTIVVTVEPSVTPWVERTIYTHPILRPFPDLLSLEGRALQSAVHATMTPMKHSIGSLGVSPSASPGAQSPMMSEPEDEELLTCEVCYSSYPSALVLFAEICGHTTCLTCATACSEKHVNHPTATLSNLQCPSAECEEFLQPEEVRAIVSHEDSANLEMNEVRIALHDTCATCPKCGCSFQRLQNQDDDPSDPKRFKFNCTVCDTSFCVNCGHYPYHEDKPCQFGATGPLCRYCGSEAVCVEPLVCEAVECRRKGEESCTVSKQCGHLCHGKKGENQCTSCLTEGCADCHPQQNAEDFCVICYCETLAEAPCLELDCGHVFHYHCLEGKIRRKWPTVRITFTFLQCPLCTKQISHPMLTPQLAPLIKIKSLLESRYLERLKIERLMNCESLVSTTSPWYNQPLRYAEEHLTYYLCAKCKKPYFGGLKMCADIEGEDVGRDELICGGCSAGSAVCTNPKHGSQYMEYKCRYCCNLAVWYCWGTTHFCDLCHSPPRKSVREECPGEEKCPLGGKHRPNGEEFAVGCAICRSEKLKELEKEEEEAKK